MSAEPHHDTAQEEAFFDAAIQLNDAAARRAFLDESCGRDSTMRAAVDELLRFHDTTDDVLTTPAVDLSRPANGELVEQPGTMIGRYRIVERIGEGGFGAVYRAKQIEPVRRDVALKIIKPGMDSREIICRFEAERQALAMMSHPHVAMVLDAGTFGGVGQAFQPDSQRNDDSGQARKPDLRNGRPYIVMELVAGLPIDAFCDARRLTVSDRLRLFLQVCRGVQHAHQKGLVHRDLKPSNVLVVSDELEDHDSTAMAKVIDFGIAKALHRPVSLSATLEFRELLGTPEYMSPEQVTLDCDIDTRADIYALGEVLYKLLTGVTPLQIDTVPRPSFDEMCRMIREVEPVMPSQRVGWVSDPTALKNDTVGSESQLTKPVGSETQPSALRRILRGDLDWIVMKALEKDRARRYETVSELAADIERHLNHEPVSAGPPSASYRASKFIARNRVLVVAPSLVLAALVTGGVAATIGFVRADRARHDAEDSETRAKKGERLANEQRLIAVTAREQATTEANKAKQVVNLLEQVLGAAHPERGKSAKYTVRELLDDAAEPLVDSLTEQPNIEATLRRTMGRAYWNLGDMIHAGPHLERALKLRRDTLTADDPLVLSSQADWAMYLVMVSRFADAESLLSEALPRLRAAGDSEALVSALIVESCIHNANARYSAAVAGTREAWEIARRVHGERGQEALSAARWHANSLAELEQFDAAEKLARETLATEIELLGADHVQVASTQCALGGILQQRGKYEESEPLLRQAVATHTRRFGRKNTFVVRDLLPLTAALFYTNHRREAEKLAREAVEIAEVATIDRESLRMQTYRALAIVLRFSDRDQSLELFNRAIELQRPISSLHHALPQLLENKGRLLREIGRPEEGLACHREALKLLRAHNPDHWHLVLEIHGCANALRQLDRLAEAEPLLKEAVDVCLANRHDRPFFALDWLDALLRLNRRDQVPIALEKSVEMDRQKSSRISRASVAMARAMIELADAHIEAAEKHLEAADSALEGIRVPRAQLRIDSLRAECLMHRQQFAEAEQLLLATEKPLPENRNPFHADDQMFVLPRLERLRRMQAK